MATELIPLYITESNWKKMHDRRKEAGFDKMAPFLVAISIPPERRSEPHPLNHEQVQEMSALLKDTKQELNKLIKAESVVSVQDRRKDHSGTIRHVHLVDLLDAIHQMHLAVQSNNSEA
jgi:hypothetical protein